jgi:hypothetical protein
MGTFVDPREARRGTIDADQLTAVRRLARLCLGGGDPATSPSDVAALVDGVGEQRMWQAIHRHRLVELVEQSALLPRQGELARALADDAARRRGQVDRHAVETVEVLALLQQRGVRVLVLKGLPLAVQTTGDPHSRTSTDIDLWVDPSSLAAAVGALLDAGWAYRPAGCYPEPDGSREWEWARRTQREVQLRRDEVSVDLHWRLAAATGHVPGFASAWRARQAIDTAWGTLPTLRPDHALAHACLHAATDDWRSLRSLVDVRRLAGRLGPDVVDRYATTLRTVRRTLLVTAHSVGLGDVAAPRPHRIDRGLGPVADRAQRGPGRIHAPDTTRERLALAARQAVLGSTAGDYARWAGRAGLRRRLAASTSTIRVQSAEVSGMPGRSAT